MLRNRPLLFNFLQLLIATFYCATAAHGQLTVAAGQTAASLAATLAGPGVAVINPTLTCPAVANGTFTYTGGPILSMSTGILLTNGQAAAAAGPEPSLISFNDASAGDASVAPFLPAGTPTFDACILEFDVVPTGDTIGFNYQFGSEEYRTGVCTQFTDVFAFFISGPGIAGTPNIALVPGTNIPVEVNSVNNGVPGSSGGAIGNCTALGGGSPFTSYYLDNTGGTDLSYRGYTMKFKAFHAVTACDTYHLKLSVVDAGNGIYDSGVFLEAGSLSSNSYKFSTVDSIGQTINGVNHTIVKGCTQGLVKILASFPNAAAQVIPISFGGTAVLGTDVATLPNTVTFPAGSTSATVNVQGLLTPANGPRTLTIYLHSTCGIFDSVLLNVIDSPTVSILTPDTTICAGQPFQIRTSGTTGLQYSWAPPAGLSNTAIADPIAAPTVTTTYTLTANLPGSGCVDLHRTLTVSTAVFTAATIAGDSVFCAGTYYTFSAGSSTTSNIVWSFGPGDTVKNVNPIVHAWDVPGIYNLSVTSALAGCGNPFTKVVTVYPAPFIYLGPDTLICPGGQPVTLYDHSNTDLPGLLWTWNTGAHTSAIAVTTPGVYYATATLNGCLASDTISVGNDCYVDIPNVFTPNGDGLNDYFFPRSLLSKGLLTFSMSVYNRWGQLVFRSESIDGNGWDGTFNAAPQPEGVFVYVIDAVFIDATHLHRQGNLTLLR